MCLDRQHKTSANTDIVDQDSAGATNAVFAPEMRSRETKILTKEVGQGDTRLHLTLMKSVIYGNTNFARVLHCTTLLEPMLAIACCNACSVSTPARCRR